MTGSFGGLYWKIPNDGSLTRSWQCWATSRSRARLGMRFLPDDSRLTNFMAQDDSPLPFRQQFTGEVEFDESQHGASHHRSDRFFDQAFLRP